MCYATPKTVGGISTEFTIRNDGDTRFAFASSFLGVISSRTWRPLMYKCESINLAHMPSRVTVSCSFNIDTMWHIHYLSFYFARPQTVANTWSDPNNERYTSQFEASGALEARGCRS